jgi:DNA-binding MarR family transcriptional regulator
MKKTSENTRALADALHSTAIHLLRQIRTQDRASGIGPAQLSALSVLVFGGSMSLRGLASAEQVKPPTMVRIVRSLGEQYLVETRADKQDGRKITISATARGRALMRGARERRVQAMAEMIDGLSEQERTRLRAAIAVLSKLMRRGIESKPAAR